MRGKADIFGVIGLGRFGIALAETLAQNGQEVLVLDQNENKIRLIQDKVSQAFVVRQLDQYALVESGIPNCSTVIVCIGENLEASLLTTLHVIELGVPRVIAKAISAEHGNILQKLGAEVVYPERERAIRLGNTLATSRALDFIGLSNQFSVTEIKLTHKLDGVSILNSNIRKKFGLNIIAIVREGDTIIEITPEFTLQATDLMVVVGNNDNIQRFERYLQK